MNTSRFLAALALVALTTGAAACSSSKPSSSSSSSTTTTAARATTTTGGGSNAAGSGDSSGEVSATATATGQVTFDGPVTGRIVCTHSSKGRIEFESQGAPQIELQVNDAADGTIAVLDQYKVMTGSVSYPAGSPAIEGARFQLDTSGAQYLPTSGTLKISDGGASGTFDADAALPGQPDQSIHYTLVWKDCPAAS